MTSTPVGMRCPECAKQRTQVRTAATLTGDPQLTYGLIVVNVIVFLGLVLGSGGGGGLSVGGPVFREGVLFAPLVAEGEVWRIITGGFLHGSLIHILFNMYFLYFLGTLLEPAIGRLRFAIIYFVSLVGGSLGAIALQPESPVVGASGAVFGLLAASLLASRARGIDPMQSGLGVTLLLNLGITFLIPGISIGGHLGGLLFGGIVGYLMFEVADRRRTARTPVLAACTVLGVAGFALAVAIA
jgi:membrane associated rhomboid family serine protease